MHNKKNSLNVPIMVLHEFEGTQYKIGGTLIDINESTNTCTVKFLNDRVENGIPMSEVYITEKFIDTIKKYGKKVASWIVKKVNGLLAIMNSDGRMDENSTCTPVNILIAQSNGELPSCIKFFPNDNQVAIAEAAGFSVDVPDDNEILVEEQRKEKNAIEKFWTRVMGVAGTTDKTIEESVKCVYEKYYTLNGMAKKLNETGIASMYPLIDGLGRKENNGTIVDTEELKSLIKKSIDSQLNLTLQKRASSLDDGGDRYEDPEQRKKYQEIMRKRKTVLQKKIDKGDTNQSPILLIWGAPGIGKTAIISQVLKNYKNDPSTPVNLYLETVSCAGLNEDSFRLPNQAELPDGVKDPTFSNAALSWLPMYKPRDAAYNQMMEDRFAKCMFMNDNKELLDDEGDVYQGGVIFLDEVIRVSKQGFQVVMNICNRSMNELVLAKSWAIISAANRYTDDPTQDSFDNLESAPILQRFKPVTYVPKKSEWLAWARSINDMGEANIEPEIADFIEAMEDYIWYRTIDNGGYDKELKAATGKDPASMYIKNGGIYRTTWETLRELTDEGKNPLAETQSTWNGRTWHRISDDYRQMLSELLEDNPEDYTYDGVVT